MTRDLLRNLDLHPLPGRDAGLAERPPPPTLRDSKSARAALFEELIADAESTPDFPATDLATLKRRLRDMTN